MSTRLGSQASPGIDYPDQDGQPTSDNTLQFQWIVTIKEGLEALFRDRPDVFVAGDLLWYPVEGDNKTRTAPDALVAFGRPKGYRGSYRQWEEGGIAPQVVFEVISPGNRFGELLRKFKFYERFGVEEYYIYDPDRNDLVAYRREGEALVEVAEPNGLVSPRLGIRFELTEDSFEILGPDGRRFQTYVELARERDELRTRADRLADRLRALGIDPDEA